MLWMAKGGIADQWVDNFQTSITSLDAILTVNLKPVMEGTYHLGVQIVGKVLYNRARGQSLTGGEKNFDK